MKKLEYLAARLALGFFRLLPLGLARGLGRGASTLTWVLLAQPRRTALRNIRLGFPEKDEVWVRRTARATYRQLGSSLGEMLQLPRFDKAWVARNVRFVGMEPLEACLAQGRGVIALGCHFGNWELQGGAWALRGYPTAVVAFPQSNHQVDELILKNRESTGMKVIYTGHHGTAQLLQHLKRGGVAGILADQNAGKDGLRLPFFGRDCSVAKAPAVLARKTGAALIPGFLVRESDGTFTNYALPEIPIAQTGDVERDILETTKAWLRVQEDFIRRYPEQYFWLHRRWKHYENH